MTSNQPKDSLILRSSIHRLISLGLTIPLLAIISYALLESEFWICFISALASAAIGAGPRWNLSATGEVRTLVKIDIIPRVLAGLIATATLFFQGSVLLYSLAILVGQVIPITLSIEGKRHWFEEFKTWNMRKYWKEMLNTGYSTGAEVVGAISFASPLLIGSVFLTSSQTPELATALRMYALALTVVTIVSNAAQSASIIEGNLKRARVVNQNFWISIVLAFGGLTAMTLLGKPFANFLFPKFKVEEYSIFVVLGCAFFAMTIATHFLRHILLPRRAYVQIFFANSAGMLVAAISFLLIGFGNSFTSTIVCLPYAAAEFIVLFCFLALSKFGGRTGGRLLNK